MSLSPCCSPHRAVPEGPVPGLYPAPQGQGSHWWFFGVPAKPSSVGNPLWDEPPHGPSGGPRSHRCPLLADDVLTKDAGECVICLEELLQGDTIARLPCLCIYHKRYGEGTAGGWHGGVAAWW